MVYLCETLKFENETKDFKYYTTQHSATTKQAEVGWYVIIKYNIKAFPLWCERLFLCYIRAFLDLLN
jgi:hypothetical protein